jgi:predicted solute-binding protein
MKSTTTGNNEQIKSKPSNGSEENKAAANAAQSPIFAAVAYLNMLPFFSDDATIELFATPRSLNQSHTQCSAYCSSLIAGLNAQKLPITHEVGVFCSGAVQSVFIEPEIISESHAAFWQRLEDLWALRHPNPIAALGDTQIHGKIILKTCGASEQSVWMFKVLSALAGFTVDVHPNTETDFSDKHPPQARLWIGDPALERRRACPNAYRIDLGSIWNSHTGQKAWFAGWFAGESFNEHQCTQISQELNHRAKTWVSRSEFSRWCAIYKFLESQNSVLLNPLAESSPSSSWLTKDEMHWDVRDVLTDYFSALEFHICAEEGHQLLHFYQHLGAALNLSLIHI